MALAQRTLELVNIPSESRSEAELYRYVTAAVPLERIQISREVQSGQLKLEIFQ